MPGGHPGAWIHQAGSCFRFTGRRTVWLLTDLGFSDGDILLSG